MQPETTRLFKLIMVLAAISAGYLPFIYLVGIPPRAYDDVVAVTGFGIAFILITAPSLLDPEGAISGSTEIYSPGVWLTFAMILAVTLLACAHRFVMSVMTA